jgi:catechol 2,3-dioxygenase-like lactoylglutathione lyase family enzyme
MPIQLKEEQMINGFHHTSITTPDLDRAVAFYGDLLGFEKRADGQWEIGNHQLDAIVGLKDSAARFVMLWARNTHLEIFEYSAPESRPDTGPMRASDHGITHLCFDVTDIDAEYARLSAAGVEFTTEPVTVFGVRTTYARDPDGNVLEFQEILDWDAIAMPRHITFGG